MEEEAPTEDPMEDHHTEAPMEDPMEDHHTVGAPMVHTLLDLLVLCVADTRSSAMFGLFGINIGINF